MGHNLLKNAVSLLVCAVHLMVEVNAGARFSSHISVNTPTRSFTHGVGDILPMSTKLSFPKRTSYQKLTFPTQRRGYPRVKPAIPFTNEDVEYHNSIFKTATPLKYNNYADDPIHILPPSPYKVDSSDPESLWPENLLLPSFNLPQFTAPSKRRNEILSETESLDPYLLEASEARAAVQRASEHGLYYFHDIPHIESLLANQELRIKNNLKPHRIASIRHTWPYNRP